MKLPRTEKGQQLSQGRAKSTMACREQKGSTVEAHALICSLDARMHEGQGLGPSFRVFCLKTSDRTETAFGSEEAALRPR